MSNEGVVETEDLRSQNTKNAEEFENGSVDSTGQHNNQEEILPEDNLVHQDFDVEELLEKEDGERRPRNDKEGRKLDLGGSDISDEVELYLVEELGYNPDSDYFSTVGSIEVVNDQDTVGVLYTLEDDITEIDGEEIRTPLIEFLDDQIVENAIQNQLDYSMVDVDSEDGLRVGFRYDVENYDPASEEVGKAISWIEDNLPDYDSGR